MWFDNHPVKWLFFPLTILFGLLTRLRRYLFAIGVMKQRHPGIPVLVVGNISVGGNGKTPVVTQAAQWLVDAGYSPGILSRGYGGHCTTFPHHVKPTDTAAWVGDEPKLMASRLSCPVVIDPIRYRGAQHLKGLGCNVVVCDDGLQHYALGRDIEWVVMDDRRVGNGALLPMGPLREPVKRLSTVNAIIHNGQNPLVNNAYAMTLNPSVIRNVRNNEEVLTIDAFRQQYADGVTALAGIGDPTRFFTTLSNLHIKVTEALPFPDHHAFSAQDLPLGATIMTEKDAVKCTAFAHPDCWYLEVSANLPNTLKSALLDKLADIASN
ncbi:tetraacyldisaccharide 4'-kinase [Alteromonas sediminis]|uniref:Tetraacyldisaccharide 4'-kinase n=1 Tax=Alteromonas sediminis TaxID=2259342 RepID=A0A3N5Y1A9_9ALTE|nr:tetraacyldisaccharide 4'-kinase [Alteromonas sediminis]RPJ67607.1 tetraacyldisaccharide 4'-kinase [Alteromonas sediminis]